MKTKSSIASLRILVILLVLFGMNSAQAKEGSSPADKGEDPAIPTPVTGVNVPEIEPVPINRIDTPDRALNADDIKVPKRSNYGRKGSGAGSYGWGGDRQLFPPDAPAYRPQLAEKAAAHYADGLEAEKTACTNPWTEVIRAIRGLREELQKDISTHEHLIRKYKSEQQRAQAEANRLEGELNRLSSSDENWGTVLARRNKANEDVSEFGVWLSGLEENLNRLKADMAKVKELSSKARAASAAWRLPEQCKTTQGSKQYRVGSDISAGDSPPRRVGSASASGDTAGRYQKDRAGGGSSLTDSGTGQDQGPEYEFIPVSIPKIPNNVCTQAEKDRFIQYAEQAVKTHKANFDSAKAVVESKYGSRKSRKDKASLKGMESERDANFKRYKKAQKALKEAQKLKVVDCSKGKKARKMGSDYGQGRDTDRQTDDSDYEGRDANGVRYGEPSNRTGKLEPRVRYRYPTRTDDGTERKRGAGPYDPDIGEDGEPRYRVSPHQPVRGGGMTEVPPPSDPSLLDGDDLEEDLPESVVPELTDPGAATDPSSSTGAHDDPGQVAPDPGQAGSSGSQLQDVYVRIIGSLFFNHGVGQSPCPQDAGNVSVELSNGHGVALSDIRITGDLASRLDLSVNRNEISAFFNCSSADYGDFQGTVTGTATDTTTDVSESFTFFASGTVGGEVMRTFSDSSGTGWDYCSGKCSMATESIRRGDGTVDKVIRVRRGTCNAACSCVLFNTGGPRLVFVNEFSGASGYENIGPNGTPANYTVRCCEED